MNAYFLISFLSIVFGFIIGSFLHVVSLRIHTRKSLGGRSHCLSCGKTLRWFELIPVVSYLIQQGRCRTCSSRIPKEVFFTEFFTGIIFFFLSFLPLLHGIQFPSLQEFVGILYLFVVSAILILIFLYDMRHKIIPDELSLLFAFLALVSLFFFSFNERGIFSFVGFHTPDLLHILAGFLVPLPFFLIWFFSRGRLIGLGDPKLMAGIGLFLGISCGFSAVIIAFWAGALFSLFLIFLNWLKKKSLDKPLKKGIMKKEIPFGPFLIFGFFFIIITGCLSLF